MVNSLLAIAAYIALIGGVIFGVKQFEKKSERQETIERLTEPSLSFEKPTVTEPSISAAPSAADPTPAPSAPSAADPIPQPSSDFEATYSEDPWGELNSDTTEPEAESTQTVLDLDEIPSAERVEESYEEAVSEESNGKVISAEPTETISDDQLTLELSVAEAETTEFASESTSEPAIAASSDAISEPEGMETAEALEPRYQVEEVVIPPTIHDPKRPNSETLENLTQDILAWGASKDLKYLPKLMQSATSSDSIVRGNAAIALGQIALSHPVRKEIEQAIPVLGKLTQDSNLQVREFAVQALGSIRSEKVLPYLESALLSSSGGVKKAANDAIQSLKLHYGKTPAMQMAQKMLEKPKSKV